MTKEFTERDIEDCKRRIIQKQRELERLQFYRIRSDFVETELADLTETLAHLEHHRGIFEYSLRSQSGVRYGYVPLGV